jgi:transposase InsO family protein
MMLFQDGSRFEWLADQPELDLIVTLDDATSAICSAFLVEEEGTASSFTGLGEVITAKGLFCSLYTDRGSHYFVTAKAGGRVDRVHLTQVGRGLAELKIEHIASYSPEGRGRMERVFGTLQRLPPLLWLHGITTIAAAKRFLQEVYIADHNNRFCRGRRGKCFCAFPRRAARHPMHPP